MTRRLLWLLSGTTVFWMLLALGGSLKWGADAIWLSTVAVLLCLGPTVLTLMWAGWARQQGPDQQLLAVLGGTGIRMAVVLAGGLALTKLDPYFGSEDRLYALWGLLLLSYLVTLALEVLLLLADRSPKPATAPPSSERQAP